MSAPVGSLAALEDAMRRKGRSERAPLAAPARPVDVTGMSEGEIAEVLAGTVLHSFAYTRGAGWLSYQDGRWQFVGAETPREAVRAWAVDRHRDEAARLADVDPTNKEAHAGQMGRVKAARWLASKSSLDHVTGLAQGLLVRPLTAFDADPEVIATPNGIVNLRTGEITPLSPEALNTKMTGRTYDPNAEHPDWTTALAALPEDAREWLQVRMGQALTGYPPQDDAVMFMMGAGSNGKSTILDGVLAAMGDYASIVPDRALMSLGSQAEGHSTELMVFKGLRLAVMEEAPGDGRRVNVSALKKIVGTSRITARLIGKDNETFDVTHALVITSNYSLSIEEQDHGTWRRWVKLPFPHRFPPSDLKRRVKHDPAVGEAVLAWLVAGAMRALAGDIPETPESVRAATAEWRAETDHIGQWLEDEGLTVDPAEFMPTETLLDLYNGHAARNGRRPMGAALFVQRLMEHPSLSGIARRGKTRIAGRQVRVLFGLGPPTAVAVRAAADKIGAALESGR